MSFELAQPMWAPFALDTRNWGSMHACAVELGHAETRLRWVCCMDGAPRGQMRRG